jgi:hypothetical protein
MPEQDKWMAHATMPVTAFFRRWTRKFERLIWMVLYDDDFEPDGDEHGRRR